MQVVKQVIGEVMDQVIATFFENSEGKIENVCYCERHEEF